MRLNTTGKEILNTLGQLTTMLLTEKLANNNAIPRQDALPMVSMGTWTCQQAKGKCVTRVNYHSNNIFPRQMVNL